MAKRYICEDAGYALEELESEIKAFIKKKEKNLTTQSRNMIEGCRICLDLLEKTKDNWKAEDLDETTDWALADRTVLRPEIFKVIEAKQLLRDGSVRNTSEAIKKVGVARSTFYKYKDHVV